MATMERKTDIAVDCPSCGKSNTIKGQVWDRSVTAVKGDPKTKQPTITCTQCDVAIDASRWHRERERAYFEAMGILTPNMLRGQP